MSSMARVRRCDISPTSFSEQPAIIEFTIEVDIPGEQPYVNRLMTKIHVRDGRIVDLLEYYNTDLYRDFGVRLARRASGN